MLQETFVILHCIYMHMPYNLPIYLISSLYVCMAIKHIIGLFVETPPCFVFICSNKFTWCFHKQNYYNLSIVYKSVLQVEIVRVLLCRK
jgi:hypothetical protein